MLKRPLARSSILFSLAGVVMLAACSSSSQTGSTSTGGGGTGGGGTAGGGTAGGGTGGGGMKPVSCTWTKETSNATCPNGACPIALDESLACDDGEFGAPGVRVAPAPDGTWLVTASSNDRQVYRLANGAEERQDGVPKEFARKTIALALGPDGALHLGADTTEAADYKGGATYAKLANGAWTSSLVVDNSDKYTPVLDLEVGSDGAPRMWIVSDAPDTYSMATPAAASGWTVANAPVAQAGAWNRFTLAGDGSTVALSFDLTTSGGQQLHALIGGVDRKVGGLLQDTGVTEYSVTSAPAPMAPSGLLFAVAIAQDDGIHVIGEHATETETENVIAAKPPVPVCVTPPTASCSGTCHETSSGMERDAFALGWTDDGTAWLAYVETKLDQIISYGPQGDPGAEFCVGNVTTETSKATLHLVRVPLDGSAPKEALSMPIARPGGADAFIDDLFSSARFVDVRGFGKDLAIGVRTGWITGPNTVRVIRVDTSKL